MKNACWPQGPTARARACSTTAADDTDSLFVLELDRWFEPQFVIPLGGMIFANTMNTVSLASERFEAERERGERELVPRGHLRGGEGEASRDQTTASPVHTQCVEDSAGPGRPAPFEDPPPTR